MQKSSNNCDPAQRAHYGTLRQEAEKGTHQCTDYSSCGFCSRIEQAAQSDNQDLSLLTEYVWFSMQ